VGDYTLTITCGEAVEVCDNGTDDNDDGYTDCEDVLCAFSSLCYETDCGDSTDNDGDGDMDCADSDCWGAIDCRGTGAVGDACDSNDDCASAQCMMEDPNGWPAGYCIIYAGDSSCTELTCPTGSTCVEVYYTGYPPAGCFFDCSSASCRTGYECDTYDYTCWPACTDNAQCVETGYCDTDSGYCDIPPEICTGGVDEDGDTLVDCADSDCTFTTDCVTYTAQAGGDTCAAAAALTMPGGERGVVGVTGDTTGSTDDYAPSCQATDGPDVAYSFTLTVSALVQVNLQGLTLSDTIVYVRQDCAGADTACSDDYDALNHSYVELTAAAGTYYILVDGYNAGVGTYNLAVNFADVP
jgi:hypothetical protein